MKCEPANQLVRRKGTAGSQVMEKGSGKNKAKLVNLYNSRPRISIRNTIKTKLS